MYKKLLAYPELIAPPTYAMSKWGVNPGNPILELFEMEAHFYDQSKQNQIAEKFKRLILKIQSELNGPAGHTLSVVEKIQMAYRIMGTDYAFKDDLKGWEGALLSGYLLHDRLDCDASSFIILALAAENHWDIGLCVLPEPTHVFVKTGETLIDFGFLRDSRYYEENLSLSKNINDQERIFTPVDPRSIFYANIGCAKSICEDRAGAIRYFDTALMLHPDRADVYYNRGFSRFRLDDYSGALSDFTRAIELYGAFGDAYFYRGKIKLLYKDTVGAMDDFSQALIIRPDYAAAYFQRAKLYLEEGKTDLAKQDYHQAIRYDNNYDSSYYRNMMTTPLLETLLSKIPWFR